MRALLRRQRRWLALVLIAVSPALGGTILPSLHPCPVDAPWLMQTMMAGHASTVDGTMVHGASHGSSQHAPDSAQHECSCVGCCAAPSLVTPPAAPIVAVGIVDTPQRLGWTVTELVGRANTIHEFLPESTAPPLV